MAIAVVCSCGKKLQVKEELAGRRGKCPACGQTLTIPQPEAEPLDSLGRDAFGRDAFGGDAFGGDAFGGDGLGGDGLGDPLGGPSFDGSAMSGAAMGGTNMPGFGQGGTAWGGAAQQSTKAQGSNRVLIYALCGGGGGLLLLILLGVLAFFMLRGRSTQDVAAGDIGRATTTAPPEQPPTPLPAETPPPTVAPIVLSVSAAAGATLEPGKAEVLTVSVTRGNQNGAIQLTVDGLPAKVTFTPVEIAADQNSAQLTVTAAADAADGTATVRILATAGEAKGEQAVSITVKRPLPSFAPLAGLKLSPGAKQVVEVTLSRNGYQGPMTLALEGLPDKITSRPVTIAADQTTAKIELVADAAAPETTKAVLAVATVGEKRVEAPLSLIVERFPYRVLAMPVTWIEPGKSDVIEITVERRSYKGPLTIQIEGLPEGITASPAEIAADQLSTKVELSVAADAQDRVRSAKVVATGTEGRSENALIARVKTGEGMLMPEVIVDPELSNLVKRGSFGGRLTAEGKHALLEVFGGTQESEAAVLEGLRWLARHQAADGHWSLDSYDKESKDCDCKIAFEKATDKNDTAATAFGLLPFLGVGITPVSSPKSPTELATFQENVAKGLTFLVKNQKVSSDDTSGDLGGGMYAHAFGTIALCEAYALTKHKDLLVPTQRAVRYLLNAQHGGTGGWGYGPRQEGDTSVVGWVFLAIRSGQMSGIPIEPSKLHQAEKFLNSTAAGPDPLKRSRYSYKPGTAATPALTAAGLLSRQYLGWQPDRPELPEGCKFLMEHLPPESGGQLGPSYFYYYATQVLHHMEGKNWDLWNHRMREHLIRTQQKSGHQQGSWSPEGCDHGARGGRMYSTALSLLTLEVYYRHLPLYRKVPKLIEE